MSHSLHIIEHPEPDFDLEAELPADLAALADQLTADADFLTGRYPSGTASKNQLTPKGETAHESEQPGPAEAPTLRRKRGGRWWLRAAAMLLMLSGLGTVLTGGDRQPASCPVSAEAIENAVGSGAGRSVVATKVVANHPKPTEVAALDPPAVNVPRPHDPVASASPRVTSVGVFHNLSGAEQEAFLDFNEAAQSLGASVSF